MAGMEAINAIIAIASVALISLLSLILHRRRSGPVTVGAQWPCSDPQSKPQNRFKRVLADNSYTPFAHLKLDGGEISLKAHPYDELITNLLSNPPAPSNFFSMSCYCPQMSDSYGWVDTEEKLQSLARLLSEERVFAVDTEQHSLRSFLGFTALMQVSTRKEDFLVDTISLHDVIGVLRPVFADQSICKVFHGADNDVIWLQRDFHIYVVNLFDTAKACEVLSKPYKSLAYLLETYCGVSTDKTLQREDWRIRPLSPEMVQYARTDAHYLLYIADCLVSELQRETHDISASSDDKFNFFLEASHRSNMVCMQLYAKERESSPGASAAASIYTRNFNFQGSASENCLEAKDRIWKLCTWRDIMARIHDESLRYIMSDQAIVSIATKAPKDANEMYDVVVEADSSNNYPSLPSPSPVVITHMAELCCLLQEVNSNIDDMFRRYLQKHLNPSGCCPLSIYNYSLLSELNLRQPETIFLKQNGGNSTAPVGKKASRELFVQKFSCKSPVYHNCRIYANDGRLLCFCDRRKLEWYLRRNLAKIVEDDPPAIMLLFEPKGRPEDEDNDFYIQSKKNICVGCGEKSHYLRYRIIPSCYRMHFPEHLKSHRSHDIVLLCVDCHEVAHSAAEKHKRKVAAEFGIPLYVQKIVESRENMIDAAAESEDTEKETGVSPLQLRTAAMALLRHGSSMPLKRRDELTEIVKAYFGGRDIVQEDLERALLVGMSPHERRRLEKKRGLSFKRHDINAAAKDNPYITSVTNQDTGKISNKLEVSQGSTYKSTKQQDASVDINAQLEDNFLTDDNEQNADGETSDQGKGCISTTDTLNEDPSEQADAICSSSSGQVVTSNRAKMVSLLGHGPHGKQVVEYLLNNHGEEGIRNFCQKWRQVFVEAINPRFLPAGWDITHSGRREFGDYSVYNPGKKAPPPPSTIL
ncbi:putative ribonuclease D [Dioscorea sansibarensis]